MSTDLHRLLARQLRKLGLDEHQPPDGEEWAKVLSVLDRTYRDADLDRYTLERAIEVSSEEMRALYLREKSSYEARLKAIFTTLQDLVWLKDAAGVYLACNPMFERLFGASEAEIIGKTDYDFVRKELADRFREHDRLAAEADAPTMNEEWVTFADDGHRALLETVKTPMRDATGKLIGVLGIARDITERKRSEEALLEQGRKLAEAEELWRFALEGAGDGVWDWDVPSGKTLFTRRWKEMIGYAEDEFDNSFAAWEANLHPDDKVRVQAAVQDYFDGKTTDFRVEFRMRCKNGSWKWILARGLAVGRDGEGRPCRMIGTHADISERKSSERLLQRYKIVLDTSIDGFWVADAQGCLVEVNEAYARMSGYAREELLGMGIFELDAIERTPEQLHEHMCRIVEQGHDRFVSRHRRKDESEFEVEVVVTYLVESDQYHAFLRDITEQRTVEDALRRSNEDLERFAYSVSHDMRQPLRAVSGHLQLLARSLKDKLDDEERENLNFALDGAKRMDSMIVSLLEYSRVGRKTETKKWISSRVALDEALSYLSPMVAQSGAEVVVSGVWPEVYASRDELTRLLQNLVGNALHYHESGKTPKVEVSSDVDVLWRVRVKDNGIGIDPGQIDRLFQFFSRLQSRAKFEGTGMGLALCRRIVEHHGGRIWAESGGEGQGSTFCFEMPLKGEEVVK